MSDAVQPWRPKGEYQLPPDDEIEVEEIVDDEDGQHSAVENDENYTGQDAARQEDQREPLYPFPRPRVHIKRTSHGSYTEAAPQRTSPPPPTRACTTPINYLERPMRFPGSHEGGRQTRYSFHHYDDSGNQVWWPESRLPSSNRTGTSRSETFPQRARGDLFRTAEGRGAFSRYLTGRMIERREDLARLGMPESTSARNVWASQMAMQSGARNRDEAYFRRRDRNHY